MVTCILTREMPAQLRRGYGQGRSDLIASLSTRYVLASKRPIIFSPWCSRYDDCVAPVLGVVSRALGRCWRIAVAAPFHCGSSNDLCLVGDCQTGRRSQPRTARSMTRRTSPRSAVTWSWTDIDGGTSLTAASCTSVGDCVVTDSSGNALESDNVTSGQPVWTPTAIDFGHPLTAISCLSAGLCVATDNRGYTAEATLAAPVVVTGAGTASSQMIVMLAATVNPTDATLADCHFDYGPTTAYGSSVPWDCCSERDRRRAGGHRHDQRAERLDHLPLPDRRLERRRDRRRRRRQLHDEVLAEGHCVDQRHTGGWKHADLQGDMVDDDGGGPRPGRRGRGGPR